MEKKIIAVQSHWLINEKLCMYPNNILDMDMAKKHYADENWRPIKCTVLHRFDDIVGASELISSFTKSFGYQQPIDDDTLPQFTQKRRRETMKRKADYIYDSVDIDVAEMQARCSYVQYPKLSIFEKSLSPIANSTKVESTPRSSASSLKEKSTVDFAKMDSNIQKILNVLTDLSENIVKVMGLLKTSVKESGTNQFQTGFTNLQFPLSTEDEVELLEASLVQESRRDSFMSLVNRLMFEDCKTSMKYILGYILQPELAVKFTLFGTTQKRSILTYKFYRSIRSNTTVA
ncbi:hypothetical protein MN116_000519 [Schistosoma mekongi]|uniref:DUF4806 domain-containing protein n=1 Tax=Schistosoma mekongi TaxID=38744 RepID=A0AAE1ZE62_SCHME|nr:hypothetical protein MN116_000519 [Schistosoma mekongi]